MSKEQPDTLHEMLRSAVAFQVENGLGEMIVASDSPGKQAAADLCANIESYALVSETTGMATGRELQDTALLTPDKEYSSLEEHRKAICTCTNCSLGETRIKFVYGAGNPNADLMFVGEAPGADEDRQGEPFVGRAGQLLTKIITAMEFEREDVYIANILKCRPPGNRDPQPDEMAQCFPYLRQQVRLVKPKLICALGRIAVQAMLQTTTPLGRLRNQWHEFEGTPLLATYHPAALLRFPKYKHDTWADMQLIMARLKEMK